MTTLGQFWILVYLNLELLTVANYIEVQKYCLSNDQIARTSILYRKMRRK